MSRIARLSDRTRATLALGLLLFYGACLCITVAIVLLTLVMRLSFYWLLAAFGLLVLASAVYVLGFVLLGAGDD